ncbi:gas vesicle protein [Nocardia sp. CA2R105]|uniref:gas vesicle protein GvpO n=1 Tax=Nocardia coffeae TaxID=2873381 RepID=UPI001CA6898C|nr:gas vesicle protein [Nocardia coffeae]MBY8857170.1 gas vesicle protein [Nocardia coffeae]
MVRKTDDSEHARPVSDERQLPTAEQAATVAIDRLVELTSKQVQGVTRMEPADDGWLVEIEVLEDRRIPSTADILALYEVEIDIDANLLAYRRIKRYHRGSVDINSGGR